MKVVKKNVILYYRRIKAIMREMTINSFLRWKSFGRRFETDKDIIPIDNGIALSKLTNVVLL